MEFQQIIRDVLDGRLRDKSAIYKDVPASHNKNNVNAKAIYLLSKSWELLSIPRNYQRPSAMTQKKIHLRMIVISREFEIIMLIYLIFRDLVILIIIIQYINRNNKIQ